ncbi:MAG: ADP-ribosylglycohydrolase family protein [Geodermatophilaceae bacterium]
MPRSHREAGALIGSVVGDALGAPFEFQPDGSYGKRFPADARGVRTEMCGGGAMGWAPGEFTDDTQMALLLASSLIECGGLDEVDVFARFRSWAAAGPRDIGDQTHAVLTSGQAWDVAAAEHFTRTGHAAGNGSLMRTTPAAIWFAAEGRAVTMDAARQISALTHGDPAAGEGCAIFHDLVRVALDGDDPLGALPDALAAVVAQHRAKWETVLSATWHPRDATESNGAVWPTLGSAVWALRNTRSFAEGMRLVLDLGHDTDTVAAVTGGLLGAVYGIAGIPMRWTSALNGVVPGHSQQRWGLAELHYLLRALRRDPADAPFQLDPHEWGIKPTEVFDGVWASDVYGARASDREFAVISLCRTGGPFGHEVQRSAYLIDDDTNSEIAVILADVLDDMAALRAEGKQVLVHCYAGQSRTGLVLRAWLMRTGGVGVVEATERVAEHWPHLNLWNDSFGTALQVLEAGAGGTPG